MLSGCISDRTGNLVSCLRLGSSRTNTAAHRDDLGAIERKTRPIQAALQSFWSSDVLCESTCSTWFNPLISKVHQKRTSFRPRLRPMANAIKTGSAWQSHELKLKARWDDKVNLCVYSHSSTRSEMRASSTPKSDQRWGSDSHLESFNQSFKYSPVHNHLLCIICSGAPWLGTPTDAGTGRPQLQWQNGRLAVQACENLVWTLDPDMLKLWRGKSPPNANVWLPYICWLTGDAAFNQTEQIEGRYL